MTMRFASRPARVWRLDAREKQIVASALMWAEPDPGEPDGLGAGDPDDGVGAPAPGAGVVPGAGVAAAARWAAEAAEEPAAADGSAFD